MSARKNSERWGYSVIGVMMIVIREEIRPIKYFLKSTSNVQVNLSKKLITPQKKISQTGVFVNPSLTDYDSPKIDQDEI